MTELRVLVNGAAGKMGKAIGGGIDCQEGMKVVAAVDVKLEGSDFGLLCSSKPTGTLVDTDLNRAILKSKPDIMVEFTNAQAALKSVRMALQNKVACVVGTTGLNPQELEEMERLALEHDTPVFVASNFALGAVLMMRFAKEAARHFPHVEIIESHHDQKMDAPSGTAISTLEAISQAREAFPQGAANEFEKIEGARGGEYQGMRVHSVRLPGYVATQEVIFGGLGQRLSIRHDSISRESFLPGVLLALEKVRGLKGLVCGLENII